jgi:5S rRNA maturation endonuclease (ribonuclease M5)
MSEGITVTVLNHDTGESESRTIKDDWIIICDGAYDVSHIQKYSNGTVILTLKKNALLEASHE